MTIPTIASLKRARARADRRRQGAAGVLAKMRDGLALHQCFANSGSIWALSDGTAVRREIADVVGHHAVHPADAVRPGDQDLAAPAEVVNRARRLQSEVFGASVPEIRRRLDAAITAHAAAEGREHVMECGAHA